MRITMVGAGYVGLVTGTCLANRGHEVVCLDIDPSKIDRLRRQRATAEVALSHAVGAASPPIPGVLGTVGTVGTVGAIGTVGTVGTAGAATGAAVESTM